MLDSPCGRLIYRQAKAGPVLVERGGGAGCGFYCDLGKR